MPFAKRLGMASPFVGKVLGDAKQCADGFGYTWGLNEEQDPAMWTLEKLPISARL